MLASYQLIRGSIEAVSIHLCLVYGRWDAAHKIRKLIVFHIQRKNSLLREKAICFDESFCEEALDTKQYGI